MIAGIVPKRTQGEGPSSCRLRSKKKKKKKIDDNYNKKGEEKGINLLAIVHSKIVWTLVEEQ